MSTKRTVTHPRTRARRQSALERRERDVKHWQTEGLSGREVGHKLDYAQTDVLNLYKKLGLRVNNNG